MLFPQIPKGRPFLMRMYILKSINELNSHCSEEGSSS